MKVCTKCGEEKDETEFRPRHGQCRPCEAEANGARRAKYVVGFQAGTRQVATEKTCPTCKHALPASSFFLSRTGSDGLSSNCSSCCLWNSRERLGRTKDELLQILAEQDGLCAGCRKVEINPNYGAPMATRGCVDHCHTTGIVRGWLCDDCNVALGRVSDSVTTLTNLADYQSAFESKTGVARPDNATSTLLSDYVYTSGG